MNHYFRRSDITRSLIRFCIVLLAVAVSPAKMFAQESVDTEPKCSVKEIAKQYKGFDLDKDRIDEIASLRMMKFIGLFEEPLKEDEKLVLVLVEDRLMRRIPRSKIKADAIRDRLGRFGSDLQKEGYATRFIQCDIYAGTQHQDGLTLLALRRFLKEVDATWNLEGVVLVGSFPEATIVRRWIWNRKKWDVTIAGTPYKGKEQKDFLRIVPEAIAVRGDIVLADLDGNWEDTYVKENRQLESIEALPADGKPVFPPNGLFVSTRFNEKKISFEDFFWLKEDNFERLGSDRRTLKLKIESTDLRNPELGEADKLNGNPIAIPDILVSRINARHVAVMPSDSFRDSNRKGFLDRDGKPQPIFTTAQIQPKRFLQKSPAFERKLLVEYFDRNHAYRSGNSKPENRTAAVHHGRGLVSAEALNTYLGLASSGFEPSIGFSDASLLDYVKFLKSPAILKGCSAHSNAWNTAYGNSYDTNDLESEVGGAPWRWREEKVANGFRYTPSLAEQGGLADSYLHRSIYENGILKDSSPSFFIHLGCDTNTPGNALRVPYNHVDYGTPDGFQNAESILFFLNGVALASRSKVFYDKPRGFTKELGKDDNKRFGDGWRAYFDIESNDKALSEKPGSNKRTYPWSIIGDWTLRTN